MEGMGLSHSESLPSGYTRASGRVQGAGCLQSRRQSSTRVWLPHLAQPLVGWPVRNHSPSVCEENVWPASGGSCGS
jgi:hypothetical protein